MDSQTPHNLPEQPNALLGRDQELEIARQQLLSDEVRLLSLTGPPGVGKTRLAMAIAENSLAAFPEGVWFIDLAALKDPGLVGSKIASTFGVAMIRDETMLDSLAAYLRDRPMLLLLDNFEGVLSAAAWVGKLLERTSRLKILTTSRERLRLRWEHTVLIPPLQLPGPDLAPDLPALAAIPSLALFLQRASAVNAHFTLSPDNAAVIANLCKRLDGLPLAIELAAARASALSPPEMLANMDDRFRLLRMGALDLPERHQTLKAAIDWSYESLPPAESHFLSRLAVFSGGFSPAAAEIITECQVLGLDALQSLISLLEKNLINKSRGPGGETRFTLFESIRDYLLDRLRASEGLEGARQRHATYYLGFAEQSYFERKKGNQKTRFDLLECEHDNLRAALQWCLDAGQHSIGRRIATALWNPFWWLRGHIPEGMRWLEAFRRSDGELEDENDQRVLEGLGLLRGWQGDHEPGKALLMEALRIAQRREDREARVRILAWLGWIAWVNGKTGESAWLAERLEASLADIDPFDQAYACLSLGNLFYEAGQDEAAERAFTGSVEYFQFAEGKQGAISAESRLALLKQKKGDLQGAKQGMLTALEALRQPTDLYVIAYCVEDAVQLLAQRMADQNIAQGHDLEKLARVLGVVDYWREIFSLPRTPRDTSVYRKVTESLERWLGAGLYLRAWREGQSMSVEKVIDEINELLETTYQPGSQARRLPEGEGLTVALSSRERQVISLVAEGLSNHEIGEHLFISERTVRFHITSIFQKLGADNRAQAVAIANRLGLL